MNNKFLSFEPINEEEIPKIPLYIDQVTGFFEEIFEDYKVNETEKTLTKTMINNYVKAGVIQSPEKKKYSKNQMMALMMIYMLKNTTQIQEIDEILKTDEVSTLYDTFKKFHQEAMVDLNASTELSREEEILKLLISASVQKRYAEMLLEDLKKSAE